MIRGTTRAIALAGCALIAAACGPARNHESFDVTILVLDACRADRIGAYGYEMPTTPAIDEVAEDPDAVVFERHYAHGSWTKPSTASLFTGRYSHHHGINLNSVSVRSKTLAGKAPPGPTAAIEADDKAKEASIPPTLPTLPEFFKKAGFETHGIVKSFHLLPEYGFARGFDTYTSPRDVRGDRKRVKYFLQRVAETKGRFFGYVHLNACHYPFRVDKRDGDYMKQFGFEYSEEERRAAGMDFTTPDIKFAARRGEAHPTPEDLRFLSLIYDAQFRKVDRKLVALLVDGLKEMDRYDDTLLIITADHGEELFEHMNYAHDHSVYEEVARVPMIVKFPKGRRPMDLPRRVSGITSNVDVMPSMLAILDQPIPRELPGRPILTGAETAPRTLLASHLAWGVVSEEHKLVVDQDGEVALYNLADDPEEHVDLSAKERERASSMESWADAILSDSPVEPFIVGESVDPAAVESLRELGYIE